MPDKIITNPVYATELFQAVAPYIESIAPEILAFELAKTSIHPGCEVNWNRDTLDSAMSWALTIQGSDFWMNLSEEFEENMEEGDIVTDIDHLI